MHAVPLRCRKQGLAAHLAVEAKYLVLATVYQPADPLLQFTGADEIDAAP